VRIVLNPTMKRLLVDVSNGIRVLQSRDGILLSEGQILERARNIVMGLVGNYRIESLDLDGPVNDHQRNDASSRDHDQYDDNDRSDRTAA
jgi:hypothetical protein